ncbi:MAG: SPOR domain-containing protein, partial [Treponema sp.]|nr:SPOR domain-containing protein [Treponema sp.]
SGRFLQAGLFSQEVNARTFAEQLTRAGFNSHVITRNINGRNHWAVGVGGGNDENAMLRSLQAAGFQAFPVQQ